MKFTGERVVIGDMKQYIPTLQEHLARYTFALQAALNKTVLDAACGSGYGTNMLAEAATSVTGTDVSESAVHFSEERFPKQTFVRHDLNKTFPEGKFDLCVSFETIEHLEKPEVFLQNVKDNCKEFMFSIPVSNPSKYHVQVWDKNQIVNLIDKYWKNVAWFNQKGSYIFDGLDNATFLIGFAHL